MPGAAISVGGIEQILGAEHASCESVKRDAAADAPLDQKGARRTAPAR